MKAGWEVKALGEVCNKIGSGATPRGGYESYKEEGISLFRSMNVHDLKFQQKDLAKIDEQQALALSNVEVRAGDVLLNITGASVARCCVAPSEMLPARVNQHVSILRPKSEILSSEFLAYLLVSKAMKDKLLGIGDEAGATRQALTKAHLQTFPIPLPPLDEQKQIVAVLDAAFEGLVLARAHTEANLQSARELFESGLENIVSGAVELWPNVELSSLTESISDGDHAAPPKANDGIPFITISNVHKETLEIDFSDTFMVPLEYYDALKTNRKPKRDDVLYSVTGSFGIPVHVRIDTQFCFQRHIGLVRPKAALNSRWLFFMLLSPHVYRQADKGASGTAQRTVSLTQLRSFSVPDVPLADQVAFAVSLDDQLSRSKQLQSHYRAKLADIDQLRQSLLQKAFAGELT